MTKHHVWGTPKTYCVNCQQGREYASAECSGPTEPYAPGEAPQAKGPDAKVSAGLKILLQLALDEMRNTIEAVDQQHETKPFPLKYGTPYGAITALTKVREDILVQCAAWGVPISPHRKAEPPMPRKRLSDEEIEEAWDRAGRSVPFGTGDATFFLKLRAFAREIEGGAP